ncbi:MAG: SDR family oxidoreductase [Bacteroidales bacterium]|nr:SDR family oxidoreductase [Bacteroidales bacterium]
MKHIIITGSSRGIGLGLAKSFLDLGCSVSISGRSEEVLNQAIIDLEKSYEKKRIQGIVCDVTQNDDIQKLWNLAIEKYSKVDIWVNNAGQGQDYKYIWELEKDKVRSIVNTNITGLIYGCQVAYNGMAAQGYGKIFNMEGFGSNGMKRKKLSVYGTTKSAVTYFTGSFVKEIEKSPVLVGTIAPGMVVTDLLLQPIHKDNPEYKTTIKVFNLMAEKVEVVTPWLASKMLKSRKQGTSINFSPTWKMMLKALKNLITNRSIIPQIEKQ